MVCGSWKRRVRRASQGSSNGPKGWSRFLLRGERACALVLFLHEPGSLFFGVFGRGPGIFLISRKPLYTNDFRRGPPRRPAVKIFLSIIFPPFWSSNLFVDHSWSANFFVNQLGYIMTDKGGNYFGFYPCFRGVLCLKISCLPLFSPVWNSSILRKSFFTLCHYLLACNWDTWDN
jgi:hypothetical protein